MWIYWRLFLIALRLTGRRRRDLVLENLVLRQQLAVWERTGRHPTLAAADRRFWSVTARLWCLRSRSALPKCFDRRSLQAEARRCGSIGGSF